MQMKKGALPPDGAPFFICVADQVAAQLSSCQYYAGRSCRSKVADPASRGEDPDALTGRTDAETPAPGAQVNPGPAD